MELRQNHSKTLELTCSRYENEVLKLGLETDGLKQQLVMSVDTERATNSQLTDMLKESTKVLKQFTKDVDSGFMGEELVRKVFDQEINSGFLEDTSRSTDPGCEDYVWKLNSDQQISVEVKFKTQIHSIHDMQKHRARIYEAARMKKISIGLFLSLKCRIPNKPLLSVENVCGVPIIYAANDGESSPKTIIQNAFLVAMALAERLIRPDWNTEQDSDALVSRIVLSFDKFMQSLNKQQDLIQTMRRQTNQSFRALEAMEKIKNEMISGIEGIRTDFPSLCPIMDDTDSNDGGSDPVGAILDFLEKNRRYPTSIHQLPEGTSTNSEDFEELIKQAKKAKKRKVS
jgi:hypothetical protein